MKLGIRTKLFLITFSMIAVSVIMAYAYVSSHIAATLLENMRNDMVVRAYVVAVEATETSTSLEDYRGWTTLARQWGGQVRGRVTLFSKNGVVLGDSTAPDPEDGRRFEGDMPEVRDALQRGHGEAQRQGPLGDELLVAVPFERDQEVVGVARLSLPLTELRTADSKLRRALTGGTLLALLAAVVMSSVAAQLASRTARALTEAARKMAAGDLSLRVKVPGRDEFAELGRALEGLALSLSTSLGELRTERDRVNGILAGMLEGVLLLDPEGHVGLINPALRDMLLLPGEAVGKSLKEVIRQPELVEFLDQARSGQGSITREIELSALKARRVQVQAAPLESDQGGLFAVFVDVTEIRRLETMRRDFVANVSHELRTPITAIRSASETLSYAVENDPGAAQQFLQIIDRNAFRLHELVEDLLDLSRIESKELRLTFETANVDSVFQQVLGLFRERAGKRRIQLMTPPHPELPEVWVDRRAVEQVISNLVDNAVKYAGLGAVVQLGAEVRGDTVRISVADNGAGIDQKHLPRLFERFYRVDNGRSRDLGGTGLGLSIVRHLVESMGGKVEVASQLGAGTTFSFTVRRADREPLPSHDVTNGSPRAAR